jgi:hypothetical protein
MDSRLTGIVHGSAEGTGRRPKPDSHAIELWVRLTAIQFGLVGRQ